MLYKNIKFNMKSVEFFFIEFKIINWIESNILKEINQICKYDSIIENENIYYLFFNKGINKKKAIEIWNLFIGNNNLSFEIFFIHFNNLMSILKTKVTKLFYKNSNVIESIENFDVFSKFLDSKPQFKRFKNNFVNKEINNEEKLSKVNWLLLKNFNKWGLELTKLLNLFFIFGNIKEIFYEFYTGAIYLNFDSVITLNRILLYKKFLVVNNVLLNIIIWNINFKNKIIFLRSINFNKNFNLFQNKFYKIKFNRPSNVLVIWNISINLKVFDFYKILLKYSNPLFIKLEKNKSKKSYILILKLNKISESINILINLGNSQFINNKLKINFSSVNYKFK